MAEGLFRIEQLQSLPFPKTILRSVLRVDTGRRLSYKLFSKDTDAREWTGFVHTEDGTECFQWGLTQQTLDELILTANSEDWAGFISHELVEHLMKGGELAYETSWQGTGTGVVVSADGYLLTNRHLVTGPHNAFQLGEEIFDPVGKHCPSVKVCHPSGEPLGSTFLCYCSTELDLAILRVETTAALYPVGIAQTSTTRHQRCWMFGYPCRTVRPDEQLQQFGYGNASDELRGSVGLVVCHKNDLEWLSDADGGPGSSGSPVFDDEGKLIGLYRGVQANGILKEKSGLSGLSHPAVQLRRVVNIPKLLENRLPTDFLSLLHC